MKQKIYETIDKIFNSVAISIIIGIMLFFKTILFYKQTIAITESLDLNVILGTIYFIVAFTFIIMALPNRMRTIVYILFDIFYSVLLFSDNLYYLYSSSFLSVSQIENLQYIKEIGESVTTLFKREQILYFIDLILIFIIIIFKRVKLRKERNFAKIKIITKMISVVVGIFAFVLFGGKFIQKGNEKIYNKDMQMKEATFLGYHIFDIKNAINIKSNTKYKTYSKMISDYNKMKETYNKDYGNIKYNFEGILKEKNIIILQLESVQEFVVNKEINGTEITPNLNKFLAENIEFRNMHMQSFSTTADSEHSTINSLYPMENGMAFSKYYTNTYDDIFKIFNNEKYFTSYMHGNYPNFWNRGNVYGRLKLDDLSFKQQFADLSENINGDLSDELLYRQGVEKLKNFEKPFFSYIVAASSHIPYEMEGLQDRSKITVDVGKYKDTTFGNYIEAVNYADYAFGVFLDELKQANLYENTAILVFGDHNGLSMYNEEMIEYLKNFDEGITDIDINLNYTRILCGLRIPEIRNIVIDKVVNKLDIKPTFTYLCGIKDGFSIGTNMFAEKDFVCLNNERIITEKYYYDGEWYDIETGNIINLSELDNQTARLLNKYYECMEIELNISNSVIINNLLRYNS